jgi:hypothetical protein
MVNNTKYGLDALKKNKGTNNTAIGAYTSYNNLDGSNNTSLGSNSAFFNTNGSNNTSIGSGSLCNNISGSLNTAIGSSALEGQFGEGSGDENVAVGAQSLQNNKGNLNTAIGAYSALGKNGSYNTFLGAHTGFDDKEKIYEYSTAIGYNSIINSSNQIMLGGYNTESEIYPQVVVPGGITGSTGSFDYINVNNIGTINNIALKIIQNNETRIDVDTNGDIIFSPDTGSYVRNIVSELPTTDSSDKVPTTSWVKSAITSSFTDGILGGTAAFTYLSASEEIKGPSGSFKNISVSEQIKGSTATFNYINVNNINSQSFNDLNIGTLNNNSLKLVQNNQTRMNLDTNGNIILNPSSSSYVKNNGLQPPTSDNSDKIPTTSWVKSAILTSFSEGINGGTGSFTHVFASDEIKGPTGLFTHVSASEEIKGPTGIFTHVFASDEIKGPTGSFTHLSASEEIKGPTGYFTYLSASQGIRGPTGSFTYLSASRGITGPTGSFTYLSATNLSASNLSVTQGIICPTGSFTNISVTNRIIGQTGFFIHLSANNLSVTQEITGPTGHFTNISVTNRIIGQTGSFTYLSANNLSANNLSVTQGITGPTGHFTNISVTNRIIGQTGSFTHLSATNLSASNLSVTQGITGPTGSFTHLLAQTGTFTGKVSATSFNVSSDYRIKHNITPLNENFNVDKLIPVTYRNIKTDKQDIGLIAHEIQQHYPYLVSGEKDGKELQSVNYIGLIGILIKEIQDLKTKVNKLENKE